MRFFRLNVDASVGTQWFPTEPVAVGGQEVDARRFLSCNAYSGPPMSVRTKQPGRIFRLNFGPFDLPLATEALAEKLALQAPNDVEVIYVGTDCEAKLAIVNVLTCRDCIDESKTVGTRWTVTDGRPDKVGQYRMIVKLVIDSDRAQGVQLMRLTGWRTPLIASEQLLSRLDAQDLEGVVATAVTE